MAEQYDNANNSMNLKNISCHVMEYLTEGIFQLNHLQEIEYINTSAARFLKLNGHPVYKQRWDDIGLRCGHPSLYNWLTEVIRNKSSEYSAQLLTNIDSSTQMVKCMRSESENGIIIVFSIMATPSSVHSFLPEKSDITNDVLMEFIVHAFSNLLTPMMALPDMITPKSHGDTHPANFMVYIEACVQRMADLTYHMDTWSKLGNYGFCEADINELLQDIVTDSRIPNTITISIDPAKNPLNTMIDTAQITRAMMNIIKNACEAMDQRGKIHISTEYLTGNESMIKNPTGSSARIGIRDHGPGISGSIAKQLFSPFFTTKPKPNHGRGLGLWLAQKIISDHHGIISFANHPTGGSVFYVHLPVIT